MKEVITKFVIVITYVQKYSPTPQILKLQIFQLYEPRYDRQFRPRRHFPASNINFLFIFTVTKSPQRFWTKRLIKSKSRKERLRWKIQKPN